MLLIQWLVGILGAGLPSGEHVVSTWTRAFALLRVFFRCLRNAGIRRPKASLICSLAFDAVSISINLGSSEKSAQSIYTQLGCDKSVND